MTLELKTKSAQHFMCGVSLFPGKANNVKEEDYEILKGDPWFRKLNLRGDIVEKGSDPIQEKKPEEEKPKPKKKKAKAVEAEVKVAKKK